MLERINDVILMDGVIKKVSYSKNRDLFRVEFSDTKVVFEFRNGKRNRADLVKKMKLNTGEKVICIGAQSEFSQFYAFGWDIKREGYFSQNGYSVVRGRIENSIKRGKKQMLYVKNGDKLMSLKVDSDVCFEKGKDVSAICYSSPYSICNHPCRKWKTEACECCTKAEGEKRYTAMAVNY